MLMEIELDDIAVESRPEVYSPVVWNGSQLVIVKDRQFNLKKLHADIDWLRAHQSLHEPSLAKLEESRKEILKLLDSLGYDQEIKLQQVKAVERSLNGLDERSELVSSRLTDYDELFIEFSRDLLVYEQVFSRVTSGNLIKNEVADLALAYNLLGEYRLSDQGYQEPFGLVQGSNIELTYNHKIEQYRLTASIPDIATIIRGGNGINIVSTNGKIAVSIKSDLILSKRGLGVRQDFTNNKLVVYPKDGFIRLGTNASKLLLNKINAGYQIELRPELMAKVGKLYQPGFAVSMKGTTFSIDPDYLTKVSGKDGINVAISQQPSGKKVYTVSFNIKESAIRKQPTITGKAPIIVSSTVLDPILGTSKNIVALDPAYMESLDTSIKSLTALYDLTKKKASSIKWEAVTPGMRLALACPMYRLFLYLSGNVRESGLIPAGVSDLDLEVLKAYGVGTHRLTVDQDILQYVSYTYVGSGAMLKMENKIDLFIPLENLIRNKIGRSDFFIKPEEKGTKYRIISVGTDAIKYTAISRAELPKITYNTAFSLRALSIWSTAEGQKLSPICQNFSATYSFTSTTYKGLVLSVTGGDCDFIQGMARLDQKNTVPLTFPAELEMPSAAGKEKIHLVSNIETRGANTISYKLTIKDDYTSKTYIANFKRSLGAAISPDLDYIEELTGNTNPGHVRAFARLYTNWRLNDFDLNKMIYMLGVDNACLAKYSSAKIYGGTVNPQWWKDDYLRTVAYTENLSFSIIVDKSKINYTTGEAIFVMNLTSGSISYSQFPISMFLKKLQIPIVYEFTIDSEMESLFDGCCWGDFDELRFLRCGIDDTVKSD